MRAAMAALACCAAGCAMVERAVPVMLASPARPAVVTAADEMVAYLARLRGLDDRALAAETLRQKQAARGDASDLARVKVALALSLAADAPEGEILALVEPVARKDAADDDLQAMASFLQVQAGERRRLRESAAAAGARLREERRQHETQKQRADALQERTAQLQERAAQLQQKLDALSELEKSLSDRQAQGR